MSTRTNSEELIDLILLESVKLGLLVGRAHIGIDLLTIDFVKGPTMVYNLTKAVHTHDDQIFLRSEIVKYLTAEVEIEEGCEGG